MKNRKNWLPNAMGLLIGLACALVLAAVFYGAMAYQLADGALEGAQAISVQESGALLALSDAQLIAENLQQQEIGGALCTVTTRTYRTDAGVEAEAVSASPAAYIARLSDEGWTAQLITGFALAGMDAVYSLRGGEALLAAREGDWVYVLSARADEQTMYALGAGAYLE